MADGVLLAAGLLPSTGAALTLANSAGTPLLTVLLLDDATSQRAWRGTWAGAERLFLSDAATAFVLPDPADPSGLTVATEGVGANATLWVLPAPGSVSAGGMALVGQADGLFERCDGGWPLRCA